VVPDVVINVDAGGDEVQRIGTTRENIISDYVIDAEHSPQQQYPLPPKSHTFSPPQVSRHIALHQLPLPMCGSGAMMRLDDDPLATNFNASNVGFQDDRR
jgi:hypothetical protein